MKHLGYEEIRAITSLSDKELKWWRSNLTKLRQETVYKPAVYINKYFLETKIINFIEQRNEVSKLIVKIRDATWDMYIADELKFYRQAIDLLLSNKRDPEQILIHLIDDNKVREIRNAQSTDKMLVIIRDIFGDFTAKIFPYFYELGKSVTQSRRSRAGSAFEIIIQQLMIKFGYQYQDQQSLGARLFKQKGLGKIVDGILPNIESYEQKRQKCLVVTMKTTLRERWQEVVEELQRTNVPSIHLLTLDHEISANLLNTLESHNITLVVYKGIQEKHLNHNNIMSFENFFNIEIPHVLKYWGYDNI